MMEPSIEQQPDSRVDAAMPEVLPEALPDAEPELWESNSAMLAHMGGVGPPPGQGALAAPGMSNTALVLQQMAAPDVQPPGLPAASGDQTSVASFEPTTDQMPSAETVAPLGEEPSPATDTSLTDTSLTDTSLTGTSLTGDETAAQTEQLPIPLDDLDSEDSPPLTDTDPATEDITTSPPSDREVAGENDTAEDDSAAEAESGEEEDAEIDPLDTATDELLEVATEPEADSEAELGAESDIESALAPSDATSGLMAIFEQALATEEAIEAEPGDTEGPAPSAVASPEISAWQSAVETAASTMSQPTLPSATQTTGSLSRHGQGVKQTQSSRRNDVRQQARTATQDNRPTLQDLDGPPELLREDPTNAVKGLTDISIRSLPAQTLPSLILTPRGNLPNLAGEPLTKAQVDELRETYLTDEGERDPNTDELTALAQRMSGDPDLEGTASWTGQTVDVNRLPPRVEVPAMDKGDVTSVLARLVTSADVIADQWVGEARDSAYVPEAVTKSFGDDFKADWIPREKTALLDELGRIADAAGIAKETLDAAVSQRQAEIAEQSTSAQEEFTCEADAAVEQIQAAHEQTGTELVGIHTGWGAWADEQAAQASGRTDWQEIREKEGAFKSAIDDESARWVLAYDDLEGERAKALRKAAVDQKRAYDAAIALDTQALLAELRAEEEQASDGEASDAEASDGGMRDWPLALREQFVHYEARTWVQNRMAVVTASVNTFVVLNETLVILWQTEMRAARDTAKQKIGEWADDQIGRERSFFERILASALEWSNAEKAEAEAFKQRVSAENTAALVQDLQLVDQLQRQFGPDLDAAEQEQLAGLGGEQRAIIDNYYGAGGEGGTGDTIAAVAAAMQLRLRSQRVPTMADEIRTEVRATDPSSNEALKIAKLVLYHTGIDVESEIVNPCHSGFEHRWGTDEDKVHQALGKIKTPEMAIAVRATYRERFGEDFDRRLRSEMSGNDLDKAEARLAGDPVAVAASDLHAAMDRLGTDEDTIKTVLRGLTDEQREAVKQRYEETYGTSLGDELESELSGYDLEIGNALHAGDHDRANAVELKAAQDAFFGPDADGIEAVYTRIHEEEWSRGTAAGLTSAQIEAAIKDRQQNVDASYQTRFETSITDDFERSFVFNPAARDLVTGLHEYDWTKVDAARLQIERLSLYADDEVINKDILGAQYDRAYRNRSHDAEILLREEERRWMEQNPGLQWTAEQRRQRKGELLSEASALAQSDASTSMSALRTHFVDTYLGGGDASRFDDTIVGLTQFTGEDEAVERLQGNGYLPPDREVHFAVEGGDDDRLLASLKGRTLADIEQVRLEWEKKNPGKSFDETVLAELSGRDHFDMQMMLKHGEPTTPEGALALAKDQLDYERRTGGTEPDGTPTERFGSLERQVERLEERVAEWQEAKERYPTVTIDGIEAVDQRIAAYDNAWRASHRGMGQLVELHRQEVDARTDFVANMVGMAVSIVLGAALAPFTGGASLALIAGMAAIVAGTATAATVLTKMIMKGDAYSDGELTEDLAFGLLDFLLTAVTFGAGKALVPTLRAGRSAMKESLRQGIKAAGKQAMVRTGKETTEAYGPKVIKQLLTETAENSVSTLAVPALLDEYGRDLPAWANVVASLGLGMAGGHLAGRGIDAIGKRRLTRRQKAAGGRLDDLELDHDALDGIRDDLRLRNELRKRYLEAYPDRTTRDFVRDLDDHLDARALERRIEHDWQRKARTELFADLTPAQKKRFANTPIERVSDADFRRLTASDKGQAVVLIKDGRPTVIVRASTDLRVLRLEAEHLVQTMDGRFGRHIDLLDEASLDDWATRDARSRFEVYEAKLDLELDANRATLERLRAQGAEPTRIAELEQMITDLEQRLRHVQGIGPLRRTLTAWGLVPQPGYLSQKPRLFAKTSSGDWNKPAKSSVGAKTDVDGGLDIEPKTLGRLHDADRFILTPGEKIRTGDYRLTRILDELTSQEARLGISGRFKLEVHGEPKPSLRLVDPDNPEAPRLLLVKNKAGAEGQFSIVENADLGLPREPDGHYYRYNAQGEIELVPVQLFKGRRFRLVSGELLEISGTPRQWKDRKLALATKSLDTDIAPKGWKAFLDELPFAGKTMDDLDGSINRAVLDRMRPMVGVLEVFYDTLHRTLNGRKLGATHGTGPRDLSSLFERLRARLGKHFELQRADGLSPGLTEAAYNDVRRLLVEELSDVTSLMLHGLGELADQGTLTALMKRLDTMGHGLGGNTQALDDLLQVVLRSAPNQSAGKGKLFEAIRARFTSKMTVSVDGGSKGVFADRPKHFRSIDVPDDLRRSSATRHADGAVTVEGELSHAHAPPLSTVEPKGFYLVDDKAGQGAFKIEQARDYALAIRSGRAKGDADSLKGGIYFFDKMEHAEDALSQMYKDGTLAAAMKETPPLFYMAYFENGQIKWLDPSTAGK